MRLRLRAGQVRARVRVGVAVAVRVAPNLQNGNVCARHYDASPQKDKVSPAWIWGWHTLPKDPATIVQALCHAALVGDGIDMPIYLGVGTFGRGYMCMWQCELNMCGRSRLGLGLYRDHQDQVGSQRDRPAA